MKLLKMMKLKKISTILIVFSIICITLLVTLYLKAIYNRDHLETFLLLVFYTEKILK